VLISGDKLLGGPQAGIILGSSATIAKLRKNPFARAMRVDKLTLSALEATLRLYLEPERALKDIPVLAMLSAAPAEIEERAEAIARTLRDGGIDAEVIPTRASVGGGAFPTAEIQSSAVVLNGSAEKIEEKLRRGEPPVIGRIAEGKLLLDLRSVQAREDATLSRAVLKALL
jgi:L-seryl-tRNA(Ser) seleniumtransferase